MMNAPPPVAGNDRPKGPAVFWLFSIRARLMGLVVAAAAPLLALIVFNVERQNEREREARVAVALEHARDLARRIDHELAGWDTLLLGLARAVSAQPADIAKNEALLAAVRAEFPDYVLNLKAHTADGGALGSSTGNRSPVEKNLTYVGDALARGGLTFSEPGVSTTSGKWAMSLVRPLPPGGKDGAGIVALTLDLTRLGALLEPKRDGDMLAMPADARVSIMTQAGLILARNVDADQWVGKKGKDMLEVPELMAWREGAREYLLPDGTPRIIAFTVCRRAPWAVYFRVPSATAFAEAQSKLRTAIALSGGSFLLALAMAWWMSARITRPIRQLAADAVALGAGTLPSPSRVTSRGEVGVLAGALNQMLAVLGQRDAALRHSEAQFRALIEQAADGVFIANTAGVYLDVNSSVAAMFGWSREELVGKSIRDVVVPEEHARVAPELARLHAGESVVSEWRFRRKDGSTFSGEVSVKQLQDGRLLATARDISERKREAAERQLFERKLLETQKLESLGVLAGGIAHDFNNILTGILGNASLAKLDLPSDSPVQENLQNISDGSVRAADLCKQMLAYSGKGRFVVQKINLNAFVEETTHLLKLSVSKRAVLRFDLYPALPAIEADATQIRQVIMNLVINASEAIGAKSGVISLNTGLTRIDRAYLGGTLLAPELPEGTYVFLEVSDNGCGMNAETQAKIFEPFFTTKFTGRGLGLAAVLGIVRGHKGALKVYSEPGRGTTFKLLFPCAGGAADVVVADAAPRAVWRGQGCVLVVDDEESVRTTAALMLKKIGFDVALVADGREAVNVFRADPDRFALVLMDLTMPHLDGEQAFTEMRRTKPDVQVVLMSGFSEQEAVTRFTGKGLANFIQKPFPLEALSGALQQVLARGATGTDRAR